MALCFAIVGKTGPLYEACEIGNHHPKDENLISYSQFIIHSSLDMLEKNEFSTQNMYLKTIDKFNDMSISGWITAQGIRFLLLHDGRSDDAIKNFFSDVYELYVRLLMNPFYKYDSQVLSPAFDHRVRILARRYF
eukprot:CAMPEP_0113944190 /NCGR_PEP_ID=MMETSP1339-20121228/31047_1 /TAXON_ID=94617 /ORGANISM="Fibrocapsa japonica" /LENGTH=134 /DNA_ID=CAMNT_0000949283 /DNA_START=8 /DNA_END=415 /DNA_ORIENTATION=+ /assembly_acc=CAM_ASM_000762